MNFIDKSAHRAEGNQIVDELLEFCWIDDQGQYINANYDDGLGNSRETFRGRLTDVLLENQGHFCSYCMKSILLDETTLEHIIPHKTKSQAEFDTYLICHELNDNVLFARTFDRLNKIIPPDKYAHDIAYYNLVASCDKNAHCNHYRGNSYLRPLFYDANVNTFVEYDKAGRAYSVEYEQELHVLGISSNDDLRLYRKIWKELAMKFPTAGEISVDDIKELVLTVGLGTNFEKQINNFIDSPKLDDFLKYRWFFDYYKS